MRAVLLLQERLVLSGAAFAEMVVWRVPTPVPGSLHAFKYSLSLVVRGVCILRYDNERGKGDHKHVDGTEVSYRFSDLEQLQSDFWSDVNRWRTEA